MSEFDHSLRSLEEQAEPIQDNYESKLEVLVEQVGPLRDAQKQISEEANVKILALELQIKKSMEDFSLQVVKPMEEKIKPSPEKRREVTKRQGRIRTMPISVGTK